jgi:uncharacterized protein (UPF0332 family)
VKLPVQMLDLAAELSRIDLRRPRQAVLRRAVSTAYYAVFHLLIDAHAGLFSENERVRALLARTVDHKDMANVCEDFAVPLPNTRWPKVLKNSGLVVPQELVDIAKSFRLLQAQRHAADYDFTHTYTRPEVLEIISNARDVFAKWERIRQHDAVLLFLACFQLKKTWNMER